MPLTQKQFKEYLALYGTAIGQWPEPVRTEAMQMQSFPALSRLVTEQQYVDEILLSHRCFEPASGDLAARIIYAARTIRKPVRITPLVWVQTLLTSLFPRPAIALTAMLTLGIVIGLGLPSIMPVNGNAANLAQSSIEDDGAVL